MKVDFSKVTKIKLTEVDSLDAVTVFLDDFEPGRGKITIECYCDTWCSYWGAMSGDTVSQFFQRANNDYLINCLSRGISRRIMDDSNLNEFLHKKIIDMRKEDEISEDKARDLWDYVEIQCSLDSDSHDVFYHVLGQEWWCYDFPERPNPDYVYLDKIVTAIKNSMKIMDNSFKLTTNGVTNVF